MRTISSLVDAASIICETDVRKLSVIPSKTELIGFEIEGSQVNGEDVTPSLLVDFGDIEPNRGGDYVNP